MWLTNLKVAAVGVAVILFYTLIAHMIPQLESEVPQALDLSGGITPEALVAAGEQVYNGAGGCGACHGLGTRAPNLLTSHEGLGPIGARCQVALGSACKAYLHASLVSPGDSVVAPFVNIMPNMQQQLGDPQAMWALVAYLQSLGGEVTVSADDLPEAGAAAAPAPGGGAHAPATVAGGPREVMQELGCMNCHAIDGEGPPVGPSFDRMGARINANRIRRGILEPNAEIAEGFESFAGVMPDTFGDQLTAAQLEAMVRFLAGRR